MKSLSCLLLIIFVSTSYSKPAKHSGFYKTQKIPYELSESYLIRVISETHKNCSSVKTFIYINKDFDINKCKSLGIKVLNQTDSTAFIKCPESVLPYLKAISGITHVAQPVPVTPLMDTSRILCRINQAHEANAPVFNNGPFTGKKVLVGIIDTEFDTRHPAFLDSSSKTRFVAIWDQVDSTGENKNKYGFGTIKNHKQLQIDTAFGSHGHFHGTLTTGAAVGSDRKSGYYGAAPDAMIIGVCYDNQNAYSIINGLQWIFSIADSLNVPCVINMSLGIAAGPHDGTSEIDKVVNDLSGPGRIVVGAAGNDGESYTHVLFSLAKNEQAGTWVSPYITKENNVTTAGWGADIWGIRQEHFSITTQLYNIKSKELIEDTISFSTNQSFAYKPDTITWNSDTFFFYLQSERSSTLNSKPHARIFVKGKNEDIRVGIRVTPITTTTIHIWNIHKKSLESLGMNNYLNGDNNYSINEIGGTAKEIIAVGAYLIRSALKLWNGTIVPKNETDVIMSLAGFSGRGPTIDGRIKPDITAPGVKVFSAMSFYAEDYGRTVYWPDTSRPYGRYSAVTGTSISAPIVAGSVALLLQADRQLTPQKIKDALRNSALKDITGSLPEPDNNWGAGKLNTFGAIQNVLGITSKNIRPIFQEHKKYISLKNNLIVFDNVNSNDDFVYIIDLKGRVINSYKKIINNQIAKPSTPGIYTILHMSTKKGLLNRQIILIQ